MNKAIFLIAVIAWDSKLQNENIYWISGISYDIITGIKIDYKLNNRRDDNLDEMRKLEFQVILKSLYSQYSKSWKKIWIDLKN